MFNLEAMISSEKYLSLGSGEHIIMYIKYLNYSCQDLPMNTFGENMDSVRT